MKQAQQSHGGRPFRLGHIPSSGLGAVLLLTRAFDAQIRSVGGIGDSCGWGVDHQDVACLNRCVGLC